jgi:multiple sugar transport system permease protein
MTDLITEPIPVPCGRKPLARRIRPWLILLPTILITVGIFYPFFSSIYYSLTNYSFRNPDPGFAGGQQWARVLTGTKFWHALLVTAQYALATTVTEILLGLLIALVLDRGSRVSRVLKVVLMFPLMVAPVLAVLLWQLMTNSSIGVLEKFLNLFGVYGFPWVAKSSTALFSVALVDIWVNTPFVMLLILAGLQSLPKSPYESARIDGGSTWFTFRTLTLPMLKPYMYIALIFRLMAALQEFAIIYSWTKGGPGDVLMNLSLTAYSTSFVYFKFAESLPYILILWVIIYVISKVLVGKWLKASQTSSGR